MARRLLAAALLAVIGMLGTMHGSMAAPSAHSGPAAYASGDGVIWGT